MRKGESAVVAEIKDNSYNQKAQTLHVAARKSSQTVIDLLSSHGWYDTSVFIQNGNGFESRFAGRIENGKDSITDPAMGG
ncbi:MAG: phospholipase domain-containing protein [Chryseolinea sp.]